MNNLRVVVFKEGHAWVAQCLEYDIGAQAPDLETLKRRFTMTLRLELEQSMQRHGAPLKGINPAPEYIQKMWREDRAAFISMGSTNGSPNSVEFEMLLAA